MLNQPPGRSARHTPPHPGQPGRKDLIGDEHLGHIGQIERLTVLQVLDALLAQLDPVGQPGRDHVGAGLGQRGRGRLQADHPQGREGAAQLDGDHPDPHPYVQEVGRGLAQSGRQLGVLAEGLDHGWHGALAAAALGLQQHRVGVLPARGKITVPGPVDQLAALQVDAAQLGQEDLPGLRGQQRGQPWHSNEHLSVAADQPQGHQDVEDALGQGRIQPRAAADAFQLLWLGQLFQQPSLQCRRQSRKRPHRLAEVVDGAARLLAWIHPRPSCPPLRSTRRRQYAAPMPRRQAGQQSCKGVTLACRGEDDGWGLGRAGILDPLPPAATRRGGGVGCLAGGC
jgi:hypothetical protein